MKTNETPEKFNAALSEPETETRRGGGADSARLAWLAFLVAVGLTGFERLKHLLFPGLQSWHHQVVTVCTGALAAVIATYYSTRRLNRALSLHAEAEKRLALDRNVLRTVTDN